MSTIKQSICAVNELQILRKNSARTFKLDIDLLELNSVETSKVPFIGRSGEGKSTLLEALATMLMPSRGKIQWLFYRGDRLIRSFEWGDKSLLNHSDISELRSFYFGFAFQDTTLTPTLTVLENLMYPQMPLVNKVIAKNQAKKRFDQVFESTVDRQIRDQYPHQLSGGQRQRVALVQAMINKPFVLFADEPTGNLDVKTRNDVMEIVDDWQQETGGMFIWVTHHENDVTQNTPHILVDDGVATMMQF